MVAVPPPPLRIVFFGTPAFALPSFQRLLASPHPVVAVVTQPDRPRGRGQRPAEPPVKIAAREHGIPVLQPERLREPWFLEALDALKADLGVVVAYGKILGERVLSAPRLGLVNVHASLLPRLRGAAPVQRALLAGDRETGVTLMRVVPALDAGPILAARRRPIGPDETADEVERDLAEIGAALLVQTIDDLAAGRAREIPQDDRLATHAPRLEKSEGSIDWRQPAAAIHNKVRGLHPWPHAFTHLRGHRVIILRTVVEDLLRTEGAQPGQVLEASGDRLLVAAGDGRAVSILVIQPEGGRRMTAREFLAGHRIPAGAFFE